MNCFGAYVTSRDGVESVDGWRTRLRGSFRATECRGAVDLPLKGFTLNPISIDRVLSSISPGLTGILPGCLPVVPQARWKRLPPGSQEKQGGNEGCERGAHPWSMGGCIKLGEGRNRTQG
jgi:hypothetical protein